MKHTPGPWNASWNGTWIVKSVAGWLIAKIAPPTHYTPEQVEGHAHLIAAAPELLGALRGLLALLDHGLLAYNTTPGDPQTAAVQLARAALAKATGGAQ